MSRLTVHRCLAPLLGLFLSIAPLSADAAAWEEVDESDGRTLYQKDEPGSDIDIFRGVTVYPYPVEDVARILTDVPNHIAFMPYVKKVRELKKRTTESGRIISTVYQVTHVPVFNDRDVVLHTETWTVPSTAGRIWKATFRAITNEGPKATGKMVRITKLHGDWELRPTKDGKKTIFTYTCHAEIGGSIPDFIAESGQARVVMKILRNLGKRCKKLLGRPSN